MLCPICKIDMTITCVRNELKSSNPVEVQIAQDLLCPKCKKTATVYHPMEIVVKNG